MTIITPDEMKVRLDLHGKWLRFERDGKRADFSLQNLSGADLRGADLRDADLRGADLRGADLRDAFLNGADLRRADLTGADLSDALTRGADLSGADLRGAVFTGIEIPKILHIDAAILAEIDAVGGVLDMGSWHTCGTSHCRAGWAVTLAGDAGRRLEVKVGPSAAGALIYAMSRPDQRVPDFYQGDAAALADIQRCAEADPRPAE